MDEKEYFIKNYPDACYGDKPLSPYWDYFQSGVEFGERQFEKKIEELEETINKLREQFALRYGLEDKVKELEKKNAELKTERGCETCTKFDEVKLTEVKEIIIELLDSCFGYNSKTVNYEVKAKAEAFLKESE